MPDPYSSEWTVSFTLRKALRSWIKPKDEHRPDCIAEQVVADLKQSNWHLIKGPALSGWAFGAEAIKRTEDRREFDEKLQALKDFARSIERFSGRPAEIPKGPQSQDGRQANAVLAHAQAHHRGSDIR